MVARRLAGMAKMFLSEVRHEISSLRALDALTPYSRDSILLATWVSVALG